MRDIIMPKLSDSMSEGTIIAWIKADGDFVQEGEEIAEIETDKATMGYEADCGGVLQIVVPVGSTVPVGGVIGTISDAQPAATRGRTGSASPLARRVASRLNVDLASVQGSGSHGRILKRDVVRATAHRPRPDESPSPAPGTATPDSPPTPDPPRERLTRTQSLIAQRMIDSRTTIPEFRVEVELDMSDARQLCQRLRPMADPSPSINDLIIKAAAVALRRHPRLNGSYTADSLEIHESVSIGFAVDVDGGLLVPTIRDADAKWLGQIARETRQLVTKARGGTISPAELGTPTFTISNLGMFGVSRFDAIINASEAAILSVGAITDRPVVIDGGIQARPMMNLTLACDHRIVYGADAARFLRDLRGLLEMPSTMML